MGGLSQMITTTQFYLYGLSHFTATGWLRASKKYAASELEEVALVGKYYCVTGANSGIGRECARYLYTQGATVFLVCRNRERGEKAIAEMSAERCAVEGGKLELVIGDVSLAAATLQVADAIKTKTKQLDALVCNAGALMNEKTMTPENIETTFAAHLAFGSYLLSRELRPLLTTASQPRVIFVTSGGMYNSRFPGVDQCRDPDNYDGQFAYTYAKRGQVLLAEHLSTSDPDVVYVSSHPGWTDTPGVESAYGTQKKWLEPMRTLWQGAEGMCWLCVVDKTKLHPGALYLDRTPQRKHLAGPFFTEGSATKNKPAEVADMVRDLDTLCQSVLGA